MSENFEWKIHNHPILENSLNLKTDHVIIDREIFEKIYELQYFNNDIEMHVIYKLEIIRLINNLIRTANDVINNLEANREVNFARFNAAQMEALAFKDRIEIG